MNVALYLRVSTDAQDTARQEHDLTHWCLKHGHDYCVFRDTASGADTKRKERAALLQFAKQNKPDAIVVTELSRWSRSTIDLLETLEALSTDGVRLIALNGPDFDIAKPLGKMMLTVLGAVAEFERGLIAERIKSGIASKKARGEHVGRKLGDDWKCREVHKTLEKLGGLEGLGLRAKADRIGCSVNTLRKAIAV